MIEWLGRGRSKPLGVQDLAPLDALELGTRPRALASAMPDLMVEAKNLAASLIAGLHGRKRAGLGHSFWQFRQYGASDASSRIDWRRSARGETLFVREMEWESAHTVRFSVDMSSSMRFASPDAREPKRDRGVIMALALAAMLTKGGERVGMIGGERPKTGEAALSIMAQELMRRDTDKSGKHRWADMTAVKPREDVIILSDFLFGEAERTKLFGQLVSRGARAHFIQIIDPVEEAFPFKGRMRFDPLSRHDSAILSGRAENWREPYQELFQGLKDRMRRIARSHGWSHTISHTDRPAATPLLSVHEALSRSKER
ncbi:MAG: DUF58 domain-containing protein [Pseudomonadota bacterium]